jgi:hypothetical protein
LENINLVPVNIWLLLCISSQIFTGARFL